VRNRPAPRRVGRPQYGAGLPRLVLVLLLIEVLGGFAVATQPAAATATPGPVPHGRGLAMLVSPPRLTIAGRQLSRVDRLEIENRGSIPLKVHTRIETLAQRSDGSSVPEQSASYSATGWIKVVPSQFSVLPGARRVVHVHIQVPAHPEPGDHDLAIILLVPPRPGKGNIRIAEGIGVPVLITAPGQVTDDVSVTGLHPPGFSAGGAIALAATIRESGNIHHSFRGPHGRLEAKAGSAEVLFPPFTVLRGSTVTARTTWANHPAMCICHITVAVTSGGHRTTATATVIIFPVVPAGLATGTLVALLAAFLLFRRSQQRRLAAAYQAGRGLPGAGGHPSPG
jgi:hypothetical protein